MSYSSLLKSFFYSFSAVCLLALTSCGGSEETVVEKEMPTLLATPSSVDIVGEGGSAEVSIVSNTAWTITSQADWLTFSKTSGSQDYTLKITADKNPGNSSRQASFSIAYGEGKTVSITVNQQAPEESLALNPDNLSFESAGGNSKVTISTISAWRASCEASWITLSPVSGEGDGTLEVSTGANEDTEERSAVININFGKNGQKTIAVTQKGAEPDLSLSLEDIIYSSSGGSTTVNITSNTSWTASTKADWVTVTPESGKGSATLTLTIGENANTVAREAVVTISYGDHKEKSISINQEAKPVSGNVLQIAVNGVMLNMIRVEGGIFTMGATEEQSADAYSDESPKHTVTLNSFSIGETEVTQELWEAVMGKNPSIFHGDKRPVENVTWYDCQNFITKLNSLTGLKFRFPTESEWEYAARGGSKTKWCKYSGSTNIGDVAWYKGNSYDVGSSSQDYGTHNVATKGANELGLYDMSGNVHEWCQDWFGAYDKSSFYNPSGPSWGSLRVSRGGSWFDVPRDCRVSVRNKVGPEYSSDLIGLRLAL